MSDKNANYWLSCTSCGWTSVGTSGELVVSTQDEHGNCISHTIRSI